MTRNHRRLSETHILGGDTRESKVDAQTCPTLALHHIAHIGIADAAVPYEMVRMDLTGAYFLSCSAGRGRILLDGRWQVCKAGWACLAPPHALLAFHSDPTSNWEFTWVRYQHPADHRPLVSCSSPAVARFDPMPMRAAVQGLHAEMQTQQVHASLGHWVELIHGYVMRFARPWQTEARLEELWKRVATRLHEPWSLEALAAQCHMSTEHIRRLCRRELGRSPMQHVTFLRMQLAATLLTTSNQKIEAIAHAVGYQNGFVFSNAFKKWVGWRPSDYRSNAPAGRANDSEEKAETRPTVSTK